MLAAEGSPTDQECKAALERRYDQRVTPDAFRGALGALVEAGVVEVTADGIHDRYALTDAGEARLRSHYEWLGECLSAVDGDGPTSGD